jgi:hypothetical protein
VRTAAGGATGAGAAVVAALHDIKKLFRVAVPVALPPGFLLRIAKCQV